MMEKPLSKEIGLWVRFIHGLDWGSQSESQPLNDLKIEMNVESATTPTNQPQSLVWCWANLILTCLLHTIYYMRSSGFDSHSLVPFPAC